MIPQPPAHDFTLARALLATGSNSYNPGKRPFRLLKNATLSLRFRLESRRFAIAKSRYQFAGYTASGAVFPQRWLWNGVTAPSTRCQKPIHGCKLLIALTANFQNPTTTQ